MYDIYMDINRWLAEGNDIAIATVIHTWGSSPRRIGSQMAITNSGEVSGSVSGGCVESTVIQTALEVIQTACPKLLQFGVSDETAWDVGLACGGSIDVFISLLDREAFTQYSRLMAENHAVVWGIAYKGPAPLLGKSLLFSENGLEYTAFESQYSDALVYVMNEYLHSGKSEDLILYSDSSSDPEIIHIFCNVIQPAETLIIVGGAHIATALVPLAKAINYQTILIDPRKIFGSKSRFPQVDRLIHAWPQQAFKQIQITQTTAIASLTHDPKIDDPTLRIALESPAFYIGVLGSLNTHHQRCQRLIADGIPEESLTRLHAPIGLDIGSQTPEEIALSILAEIVAVRHAVRVFPQPI